MSISRFRFLPALQLCLLCAPPLLAAPPSGKGWIEVRTEHFLINSNDQKARTAGIGRELEKFRLALVHALPALRIESPLPSIVFVFRERTHFAPYQIGRGGRPEQVDAYFLPTNDANYIALVSEHRSLPLGSVYYGYTQALIDHNVPWMPLWATEGLAQYFVAFRTEGRRAWIGTVHAGHLERLARVQGTHRPAFAELFRVSLSSPTYRNASSRALFQAQAWAFTHYLRHGTGDDAAARYTDFLRRLMRREEAESALEAAYGNDLAGLGADFDKYLRDRSYPSDRLTFKEDLDSGRVRVTELSRAEALSRLGDLLLHRQPSLGQGAKEHFRAAIEIDPNNSAAWTGLGMARLEEEKHDEALESLARAIAADPENARALRHAGRALLDPSYAGRNDRRAREMLARSLAIEADHPESQALFGKTFLVYEGEVTEGISALIQATGALPSRVDILLDLIVLTAKSGNIAGAFTQLDLVLRPLRPGSADIQTRERALTDAALREARARDDRFNRDAAIALLQYAEKHVRDETCRADLNAMLAKLGVSESN